MHHTWNRLAVSVHLLTSRAGAQGKGMRVKVWAVLGQWRQIYCLSRSKSYTTFCMKLIPRTAESRELGLSATSHIDTPYEFLYICKQDCGGILQLTQSIVNVISFSFLRWSLQFSIILTPLFLVQFPLQIWIIREEQIVLGSEVIVEAVENKAVRGLTETV